MRLKTIYSGMILAALVVLAACNASDTTVNTNTNTNPAILLLLKQHTQVTRDVLQLPNSKR